MQSEVAVSSFHALIGALEVAPGARLAVIGRVLERIAIASPEAVSQAGIARGEMLSRPTEISPATVGRALQVLNEHGLVQQAQDVSTGGRPGSPGNAWSLDPDHYGVIGVHIDHRDGHVTGLTAVVARLNLSSLIGDAPLLRTFDRPLSGAAAAEEIAALLREAEDRVTGSGRKILGVGIEIGGHIHDGHIMQAHNAGWDRVELAQQVADLTGLATVVENDINARAVLHAYRHAFKERDFVVIAVLHEGVGGALVLDGRLHRGAGGVAGEMGHLFVDYESLRTPTDFEEKGRSEVEGNAPNLDGFRSFCSCGRLGHVETLAAPARILGELKADELAAVASAALLDRADSLTPEARVFRRAGTGLGRGLVAIANIVNPARIVLLLPPEIARAAPGHAASAYLQAVETTLNDGAFSTAADDARAHGQYLTVEALSQADIGRTGAEAAGVFVLHAFIEAARGRRMVARAPRKSALQPA